MRQVKLENYFSNGSGTTQEPKINKCNETDSFVITAHRPISESHLIVDVELEGELTQLDITKKIDIIYEKEEIFKKLSKSATPSKMTVPKEKETNKAIVKEINVPICMPRINWKSDGYYRFVEETTEDFDANVDYDLDNEDISWLGLYNKHNNSQLMENEFEMVIDRLERVAHIESQYLPRMEGTESKNDFDYVVCAVCLDDESIDTNVILFCDACNLAVHQDCYGVPYIPEGKWLCSPCQKNEGDGYKVGCCFCPVVGGALKATIDGRWAHVICALWIPEVGFGNIKTLEPIVKLNEVPIARRKLTCSVCRKRGGGACIQCMRKNCYMPFHIMCAQQVGIYMRISSGDADDDSSFNVCKQFLCNIHKPFSARAFCPMYDTSGDEAESDAENINTPRCRVVKNNYEKIPNLKKRKISEIDDDFDSCNKIENKYKFMKFDKKDSKQNNRILTLPKILTSKLSSIAEECINSTNRIRIMSSIYNYWILKRKSRNNLPLLRKFLHHSFYNIQTSADKMKIENWVEGMGMMKRLRRDMEKLRLLLELVRKREKLKLLQVKLYEQQMAQEMNPLHFFLNECLLRLQEEDDQLIFAEPVPIDEIPGYLDVIKNPMDFSKMKDKLDCHEYQSITDLKLDFDLMINNCLTFNQKNSLCHKEAVRIKNIAVSIFEESKRHIDNFSCDKLFVTPKKKNLANTCSVKKLDNSVKKKHFLINNSFSKKNVNSFSNKIFDTNVVKRGRKPLKDNFSAFKNFDTCNKNIGKILNKRGPKKHSVCLLEKFINKNETEICESTNSMLLNDTEITNNNSLKDLEPIIEKEILISSLINSYDVSSSTSPSPLSKNSNISFITQSPIITNNISNISINSLKSLEEVADFSSTPLSKSSKRSCSLDEDRVHSNYKIDATTNGSRNQNDNSNVSSSKSSSLKSSNRSLSANENDVRQVNGCQDWKESMSKFLTKIKDTFLASNVDIKDKIAIDNGLENISINGHCHSEQLNGVRVIGEKESNLRRTSNRMKISTRRYLIDDSYLLPYMASPLKRQKKVYDDPPVLSRCSSPQGVVSKEQKLRRANSEMLSKPPRLRRSFCAYSKNKSTSDINCDSKNPFLNPTNCSLNFDKDQSHLEASNYFSNKAEINNISNYEENDLIRDEEEVTSSSGRHRRLHHENGESIFSTIVPAFPIQISSI